MPTIYKNKRYRTPVALTEKQLLRRRLYNNRKWRRLRDGYLMEHPICEHCHDRLATDVHHVMSPFGDGLTEMERIGLLIDPNNLQALCQECHGLLHSKEGKK